MSKERIYPLHWNVDPLTEKGLIFQKMYRLVIGE
jgi:hypothetical protein